MAIPWSAVEFLVEFLPSEEASLSLLGFRKLTLTSLEAAALSRIEGSSVSSFSFSGEVAGAAAGVAGAAAEVDGLGAAGA